MKLLLDTHLLLWAARQPSRLSRDVRALIEDARNQLHFSVVSIWEVAIKRGLDRSDFTVEPAVLRRGLLDNDYVELPISSNHAIAVTNLPMVHRDPFDRLLIAQATVEGITLLTNDNVIARYPGPIRKV